MEQDRKALPQSNGPGKVAPVQREKLASHSEYAIGKAITAGEGADIKRERIGLIMKKIKNVSGRSS